MGEEAERHQQDNHLVYHCLQPQNSCSLHTHLIECGDPTAETYRLDSETGDCMNSGWVFDNGSYYIREQKRAEALCQKLYGSSLEETYSDLSDAVFYTEWDENESPQ